MKATLKTLLASSLMLTVALLFNFNQAAAQDTGPPQAAEGKTVVEVVNDHDGTSEFGQLLAQSGYAQVLQSQGPYTIVAPSNEALQEAQETMGEEATNPKNLVQGHLYQGEVPADQVESQMGVTVEETDETAANGIVHVVDRVVQNQ